MLLHSKNNLLPALALLLSLLCSPAAAQSADDGFQRRNGQMSVVRNGQPRPMTRDAHLPTGVVVTKDGFLINSDGQRQELAEGQGCDLRGRPVAVREVAGRLALAPAATWPAPGASARAAVAGSRVSLLDELLGDERRGKGWYKYNKKGKRGKHKGRDNDD